MGEGDVAAIGKAVSSILIVLGSFLCRLVYLLRCDWICARSKEMGGWSQSQRYHSYTSGSSTKGIVPCSTRVRLWKTVLDRNDATPGKTFRGLRYSAVFGGVSGLTTQDAAPARRRTVPLVKRLL